MSSHFWRFSRVHWNSIYDSSLWCCSSCLQLSFLCFVFLYRKPVIDAQAQAVNSRWVDIATMRKIRKIKQHFLNSQTLYQRTLIWLGMCLRIPHLSEYWFAVCVFDYNRNRKENPNHNNLRYPFHQKSCGTLSRSLMLPFYIKKTLIEKLFSPRSTLLVSHVFEIFSESRKIIFLCFFLILKRCWCIDMVFMRFYTCFNFMTLSFLSFLSFFSSSVVFASVLCCRNLPTC